MNYYNENDPSCAAWIRELISAGLIPDGEVDTRSIVDVQPADVRGYLQCHFFCGVAGWSEALRLAEWPREREVWTGSCPCQPYSVAGKQQGHADARDLWPEFARLIRECKPECVIGEQVEGAIRHGWLDRVCGDLEAEGYAVGSAVLGAHSVGAPHIRQRLYWVANRNGERWSGGHKNSECEEGPNSGVAMRCANGGLANSPSLPRAQHVGESWDGSRRGLSEDHASECRGVGGLADSSRSGLAGRQEQPAREERQAAERSGDAGGMGYANEPREDFHSEAGSPRPTTRESGFWSNFDIIQCLDGKARRIESGTFPLVARIPRGMVPSGDPGPEEAQASGEARVMRLRGYGNSIVPQVAAEFVRSFFEIEK